MLTLAERRIQARIEELRRAMNSMSPEEQLPLLQEFTKLQKRQRNLKDKLKKED